MATTFTTSMWVVRETQVPDRAPSSRKRPSLWDRDARALPRKPAIERDDNVQSDADADAVLLTWCLLW